MSGAAVVPLGASDAGAAVALWRAAGLTRPWNDPHADFAAALACPVAMVLGVREAARLVGTVMAGYDGHRGWIYYLAVAEERRGCGIGRRLAAAAEAWLREQGAPKAQLMVRDGNDGAAGFYRALGYERGAVAVFGRWLARD